MAGLTLMLSACGLSASTASASPVPQAYPPVQNLVGKLRPSTTRLGPWHTLTNLPLNTVVEGVTSHYLLLSVFPDPTNGWQERVYAVNLSTGKKRTILHLPVEYEASALALSGDWLVYADSLAMNGSYRSMKAINLTSHHTINLLTLPQGSYSVGNVKGLSVVGHMVYWLSTILTPAGLVSRVYADNLSTHHRAVVAWANQSSENNLFRSMVAGPQGLWISVAQNTNIKNDSTGALWFWSFKRHQVTQRIPVFHALTTLYGAVARTVLFSGDYRAAKTSTANPGPFPVYALNVARGRNEQLTSSVNPGGIGAIDGPWVTVDGLGDHSQLMNLSNHTILSLPFPQSTVGGGWLVVRTAHRLEWQRLP